MTDITQTNLGGQTGGAAALASDNIVIDKNKSQEQYMEEASVKYIIPPLVREKFPDLIKLIFETESMNQEEREYWLQIMPIMSEDQIVKFRDILVTERDQLAKLDRDYQAEVSKIKGAAAEIDEAKMKEKLQGIKEAEKSSEEQEKIDETELLKKLEDV